MFIRNKTCDYKPHNITILMEHLFLLSYRRFPLGGGNDSIKKMSLDSSAFAVQNNSDKRVGGAGQCPAHFRSAFRAQFPLTIKGISNA